MKKKIKSIVTKVVGFALALTLSVAVPVNEAQAAHSSGGNGLGVGRRVYGPTRAFNEFIIYDYSYCSSRDVWIDYKDGTIDYYMFVFITYDGSTLEIYDWDTGRRITVVHDAVLKRIHYTAN